MYQQLLGMLVEVNDSVLLELSILVGIVSTKKSSYSQESGSDGCYDSSHCTLSDVLIYQKDLSIADSTDVTNSQKLELKSIY